MRGKAYGIAQENWLLHELRDDPDCLDARRVARSAGPYDVIAIMKEEVWLIQIKGGASTKCPPAERKALAELASAEYRRSCWVFWCYEDFCLWELYIPDDSGEESGWFEYPDGPFGKRGQKVKLRKETPCPKN